MSNSFRQRLFGKSVRFDSLQKWALPAGSLVALAIACRDDDYADGHVLATLLSGELYKLFIVLSVALLAFLAFRRRSLRPILGCVLLIVACLACTNLLKYSILLPRPPRIENGKIVSGFSPGFPSAHTAFTFGLAWLLALRLPRLSLLWFGFAVAVGWSRVELQSHYPYQVLAGAVLGMALGWWIGARQGTIFPRLPLCPVQKKPAAEIASVPISTRA